MTATVLIEQTIYFLFIGTILSYLGGAVFKTKERIVSGMIATIALALSIMASFGILPFIMKGDEIVLVFGHLVFDVDLLGWLVVETGLILALIVSIYSLSYMEEDTGTNKFFPLLLLLVISIIGLAFTPDLFTIYLFFELLSITSFTLVAFRKKHWEPVEAGIKFLVMSATGSALILLGIAMVYKDLGALDLNFIFNKLQSGQRFNLLLPLSCFTIGFGIKAAMFPLHTWLPDAHSEAPSGISAMLSGIIIEIGLFTLIRVFLAMGKNFPWGQLFIYFGLFTMVAGNLMALTQKHLKRMLAYSSVSQMGYILVGLGIGVAYNVFSGYVGGVFHIITHAFMKGLAFLCAGALIYRIGSSNMDDMRGAGRKMPITALTFSMAVLSLAGVPPLSGFMSKLLIYQSGIQSATAFGWIVSIITILNSVFSLGYYLPVIGLLYSKDSSDKVSGIKEAPFMMSVALIILALITLYLGIMPDPVRSLTGLSFTLLQGAY